MLSQRGNEKQTNMKEFVFEKCRVLYHVFCAITGLHLLCALIFYVPKVPIVSRALPYVNYEKIPQRCKLMF